MSLDSVVVFVGNLAIALSFLAALIFGIVQVRAASRDRRERLTLETIRSFQSRDFAARLQHFRSQETPADTETFYALPVDEQVSFIHFAQEMEMLGLLVYDGTLDVALVERTLGNFVSNAWTKHRGLLEHMRVANDDPYLGEYFEWLALQVQARMREAPRKPAYLEARAAS